MQGCSKIDFKNTKYITKILLPSYLLINIYQNYRRSIQPKIQLKFHEYFVTRVNYKTQLERKYLYIYKTLLRKSLRLCNIYTFPLPFLITLNFTPKKNKLEPTKTLEGIQFKPKKRSSHIVSGTLSRSYDAQGGARNRLSFPPFSINLHALPVSLNSLSSLASHSTTHRLPPSLRLFFSLWGPSFPPPPSACRPFHRHETRINEAFISST